MATQNPEISDPNLLARLRWQCRRGMLELDLLLSLFLDEIYPKLSFEERELFAKMLQYPDPVLYQWLLVPKQEKANKQEEKSDENMALDQDLEALIQKIRIYMSVKNQKTGQEHF